jgi:hypothetical protein
VLLSGLTLAIDTRTASPSLAGRGCYTTSATSSPLSTRLSLDSRALVARLLRRVNNCFLNVSNSAVQFSPNIIATAQLTTASAGGAPYQRRLARSCLGIHTDVRVAYDFKDLVPQRPNLPVNPRIVVDQTPAALGIPSRQTDNLGAKEKLLAG